MRWTSAEPMACLQRLEHWPKPETTSDANHHVFVAYVRQENKQQTARVVWALESLLEHLFVEARQRPDLWIRNRADRTPRAWRARPPAWELRIVPWLPKNQLLQ